MTTRNRFCLALGVVAMFATPMAVATTFIVNDFADAVDAAPGDGVCRTAATPTSCTLRAAIQEANASPGPDEITLSVGVYSLELAGAQENAAASGDLDISDSVTITGAGINRTIIDGMKKDRLFDIYDADGGELLAVSISGVTIRNGLIDYDSSAGGALLSNGRLVLTDVLFHDNAITGALGDGGALCNLAGKVEMTRVTFTKNSAKNHGGAACNHADGEMVMTDSLFDDNTTIVDGVLVHSGGALYSGGTLTATNSQFTNNYSVFGGALFLQHGVVSLTGVDVSTNSSWFHGGGIHVGSHDADGMGMAVAFTAKNSTFRANKILGGNGSGGDPQGGGLFVTGGSQVTLEDSQILDNDARGGCTGCLVNGGGISIGDGDVNLTRVRIAGNKAAQWGGGIFVANNQNIQDATNSMHDVLNFTRIVQSEIVGNQSLDLGGGISAEYGHNPETMAFISTVTLEQSLVADNKSFNGGGIVGSLAAINSTLSGNQAKGDTTFCGTDATDRDRFCGKGGAIYVPGENYVMSFANVTFANNTSAAPSGGTDIYNRAAAPITVNNSIFDGGTGGANCVGPIVSANYNVSSDDSCGLTGADDLSNTDPLLLPLAQNGVATGVKTHALDAASPALDLIPMASCPSVDQRGFERGPDFCDAGALESETDAAPPAAPALESGGGGGGGAFDIASALLIAAGYWRRRARRAFV